jgi:hypothetical protein
MDAYPDFRLNEHWHQFNIKISYKIRFIFAHLSS